MPQHTLSLSHTHRHTKINKALFLLIALPAFETFPEEPESVQAKVGPSEQYFININNIISSMH